MDIESLSDTSQSVSYTPETNGSFSAVRQYSNHRMSVEFVRSPTRANPNSQDVISGRKNSSIASSKNITVNKALDLSFGDNNEPENTRSPSAFTFFGEELTNDTSSPIRNTLWSADTHTRQEGPQAFIFDTNQFLTTNLEPAASTTSHQRSQWIPLHQMGRFQLVPPTQHSL